jgi:ABC-type transport system substrate-binding protein
MKRMRNIKTWGIVLAAVFAFSAVSVANASASTFKSSSTGTLKGAQTSNQVFNTGFGTVSCTTATSSGTVTSTVTAEQEVGVKYSGCTAFGFIGAEISEAKYLFNANGTVKVLNTITIKVPGAGCSVTVSPQGPLSSITYTNKSGKIEESTKVSGIKSKGSGGLCGGENSNGTYTGSNLIELVGGTTEWVA